MKPLRRFSLLPGLLCLTAPTLGDAHLQLRPQGPPSGTTVSPTSDLSRLLDLAALRLKVQIDYDPANPLLKGQQVTLRQPGGGTPGAAGANSAMSDQELWAVVSRLLVLRGLTTVRSPASTSLSVVRLEDAPRLARLEPAMNAVAAGAATGGAAADAPQAGTGETQIVAGFRNQPVRLRYVSQKEAAEALRSLQRPSGQGGGAAGSTGSSPTAAISGDTLLLSDISPRIDEQLDTLKQLDTPENATVVLPVPVSNVAPAQAAAAVMQLATKREAVSGEKLPGEVMAGGGGVVGGTAAAGGAGATGSVLVVAPQRVVERWKQLIALADTREPVTTLTYTPRLFAVKDVGNLIQQIANDKAGQGAGDDRFKLVIEEPTGSLIVTGTPTQHEKIAALMARLDAVPGESRRPVRSFLIRNRSVTEFVATLQRLVQAGVLEGNSDGGAGFSTNSPSAAAPSGLAVTPPPVTNLMPPSIGSLVPTQPNPGAVGGGGSGNTHSAFGSRSSGGSQQFPLSITADEPTNTVIAVGDGRVLDQLETLIKTLDVRQPQVMLEAVLVSLTDTDSLSLGVELQQLSFSNNMLSRLSSIFGLGIGTDESGPGLPIGGGQKGGNAIVLDPGDYSVVVRALRTLKHGRTISTPKMLVANNQKATLNAVDQQPFAASFTAGNASTPTTSYGGSQDAGTQMTIRPQIGDGGGLLLDYNISISGFTGDATNANLPPPRHVTSVQSLASIPDGYAIVVSGLELATEGDDEFRVPLLGDIPVLGNLFKSQTHGTTRTRFFVFIRASVMRDQTLESLRYVSDVDATAASLPSSWPKSAPQVVR